MNYIAEIKAFYDLVQVKQLSQGQIALWHSLMYINNKCAWIEWFSVLNMTLELNIGLSRSGIAKARNALKQYGLIDFKQNSTKATTYKMFTMLKSEQVDSTMLKSNQVSNQVGVQVGNQVSKQDSNQIGGTLNKRNETNIYSIFLNKTRTQFDTKNFLGKTKATVWAKTQAEWQELTEDERLKFITEI